MAINQPALRSAPQQQREPQEKKKDWMERLIEGLQIAKGVTGIASDVGTIKNNSIKNQQLEDQQSGVLSTDQFLSATKGGEFEVVQRGPDGKLPEGAMDYRRRGPGGEIIDSALRRVATKPKETPLMEIIVAGPNGEKMTKVVPKTEGATYPTYQEPTAPKDPKTRAVTYKDANGNEVTEIVEDTPGAKFGGTPAGGSSFQAKVKQLNASQLQRFDSASMGLQAVKGMTDAYNKGDNTFSVFGDNSFTMSSAQFEDALGRMQSGGAINADEAAKFRKMRPTALDDKKTQQDKLTWLWQEMSSRISNLGFDPAEVLAERAKMPVPSFVDQSQGTATAAPGAKPAAEMTDAELDAELARLKAGKK